MKRLEQLDALRGLAALTVVATHFLDVFPQVFDAAFTKHIGLLWYSPLHIFWAGHEAVLLFFVLSGFVLSIALEKETSYRQFVIKRVCRIYIPYVTIIAAALLTRALVYHGVLPLSEWFQTIWKAPMSMSLISAHFFLIGSFDNDRLVPVIWSLVHEMRISLIFPFLMLMLKRYTWKISLVAALVLAVLGFAGTSLLNYRFHSSLDYFDTVQYIPVFIVGAILARHRNELSAWFRERNGLQKVTMLLAGLFCYTFHWWFFPFSKGMHRSLIDNTVVTAGASLFLMMCVASVRLASLLGLKPLRGLGKASYSLYLVHTVCLAGLIHLFLGVLPLGIILVLALVLSFAMSIAGYYGIEKPSIRLSQYLTGKKWGDGKRLPALGARQI